MDDLGSPFLVTRKQLGAFIVRLQSDTAASCSNTALLRLKRDLVHSFWLRLSLTMINLKLFEFDYLEFLIGELESELTGVEGASVMISICLLVWKIQGWLEGVESLTTVCYLPLILYFMKNRNLPLYTHSLVGTLLVLPEPAIAALILATADMILLRSFQHDYVTQ